AASLYHTFMLIGAIGTLFAFIGYIGAWITSNVLARQSTEQISQLEGNNEQSAEQISQLESQINSQRMQLAAKDDQIASLQNDLSDFKRYEWLARLDMFASPVKTAK